MFGQQGSNSPTEPMTLGSSPSSPSNPLSGGGSQGYLPGFLTGTTIPTSPSATSDLWSVRNPPAMSPLSPYVTNLHINDMPSHSKTTRNIPSQRPRDKPGVPPTQVLFDNLSSPAPSSPFKSGMMTIKTQTDTTTMPNHQQGNLSNILTPNQSFNKTINKSFISPAQIDPFYTQGEALTPDIQLDETWITVFGFPPAAASYILQQFSQCGTILKHQMATCGNWMHIHYETKLQAKKAIGKNGKIFGDTIMIGVVPCIEKAIMKQSSKENFNHLIVSSPFASTDDSEIHRGTIRPLTQAYQTAISNHKVTPQSRTPQKNNNIVSKAMEYIFNW